ncbi:MAG: O-antigen ligase family protein [Flavobacteriaceae bacterium]
MKNKLSYIALVGLHIAFGGLVFLNRSLGKIYFVIALLYFLHKIIVAPKSKKTIIVLMACAYFVGAEVLFRMTKSSFFYESSKYLVILFCLMGIFYKNVSGKAYAYFIYLLLLVPAIFVASMMISYEANFRKNILFVLSGPISLGIAALFCYDKKISRKELNEVLLYIALPLIALTTYVFLYTPSVKEVLSGTGSNAATSGGFGANQVATVLGLGMLIIGARLFVDSPKFGNKILNILLFIIISFRAVVTFSRGGVITALLSIVIFLLTYFVQAKGVVRSKLMKNLILFSGVVLIIWVISSNQTRGLIDKRYANENAMGEEKSDVSTGRLTLFAGEIEGFVKNPFFGIGASGAKEQRIEETGQGSASHNEVSRLLAEHGMLGILILIILIVAPLVYRNQNKGNYYFYAFLLFWFATINHSSMRIAAPGFIYALALLHITNEKTTLYRK